MAKAKKSRLSRTNNPTINYTHNGVSRIFKAGTTDIFTSFPSKNANAENEDKCRERNSELIETLRLVRSSIKPIFPVKRKKDNSMYFNDDSIHFNDDRLHFNDDNGLGPYGDVKIQEGSGSRSGLVWNENGTEFALEDEIPHSEESNEVFSILQAIREGEISSESLQESIRIPSWSNQNNLKHLRILEKYDSARIAITQEFVAYFHSPNLKSTDLCSCCNVTATISCTTCRKLGIVDAIYCEVHGERHFCKGICSAVMEMLGVKKLEPISLNTIFKEIKTAEACKNPISNLWRLVEQIYFIQSDLKNTINYCQSEKDRFWNDAVAAINEPTSVRGAVNIDDFQLGGALLMKEQVQNLEYLRTDSEKCLNWLQTRSAIMAYVEEVKKGFDQNIHKGMSDFNNK